MYRNILRAESYLRLSSPVYKPMELPPDVEEDRRAEMERDNIRAACE